MIVSNEDSVKKWLTAVLGPVYKCPRVEPAVLPGYVLYLVQKGSENLQELRGIMISKLDVFLNEGTERFVDSLLSVLKNPDFTFPVEEAKQLSSEETPTQDSDPDDLQNVRNEIAETTDFDEKGRCTREKFGFYDHGKETEKFRPLQSAKPSQEPSDDMSNKRKRHDSTNSNESCASSGEALNSDVGESVKQAGKDFQNYTSILIQYFPHRCYNFFTLYKFFSQFGKVTFLCTEPWGDPEAILVKYDKPEVAEAAYDEIKYRMRFSEVTWCNIDENQERNTPLQPPAKVYVIRGDSVVQNLMENLCDGSLSVEKLEEDQLDMIAFLDPRCITGTLKTTALRIIDNCYKIVSDRNLEEFSGALARIENSPEAIAWKQGADYKDHNDCKLASAAATEFMTSLSDVDSMVNISLRSSEEQTASEFDTSNSYDIDSEENNAEDVSFTVST